MSIPAKARQNPRTHSINAAPTLPVLLTTDDGVEKMPVPIIRLILEPQYQQMQCVKHCNSIAHIRNVVEKRPKCLPNPPAEASSSFSSPASASSLDAGSAVTEEVGDLVGERSSFSVVDTWMSDFIDAYLRFVKAI